MPDQQYRGTHRHRPPAGWHPPRRVPETTDRDTLPGEHTQPYLPTFDTGEFPSAANPVQTLVADPEPSGPIPAPAQSEVVPRTYQCLKRWAFILVVAGVWIVAAPIGLGLYYWWFHSLDKTPTVFVVLIFLMVCTVGSVLIAMVKQQAVGRGAGDRTDVGAARGDGWRGGTPWPLLLRSGKPLFGRPHSLLGLAG